MYEKDVNMSVVVKVSIMSQGFCGENAVKCTNHTFYWELLLVIYTEQNYMEVCAIYLFFAGQTLVKTKS